MIKFHDRRSGFIPRLIFWNLGLKPLPQLVIFIIFNLAVSVSTSFGQSTQANLASATDEFLSELKLMQGDKTAFTPETYYAPGGMICVAARGELVVSRPFGYADTSNIESLIDQAAVVAAIIGEEKIADWEQQLSGRARFRHILLFQATVPSEIPGYVLGILRYPFPMYLAALAITELPYAIAVIYLGDSFLEGKVYALIIAGIAVMLLGALLLKVSRKLWRGHGKPHASGQSLN